MPEPPARSPSSNPLLRRELSLLDTTSIIVGIIIGSAIYEISPLVVQSAGGWAIGAAEWPTGRWEAGPPGTSALTIAIACTVMGVWLAGGLVALVGALCYAELATEYPHAGGTYVFLSECFGRRVGLAFAWVEFWIVRPGNVGAVAFILARYGRELLPAGWQQMPRVDLVVALLSILGLAVLNAFGLRAGKWTQNALSAAKIAGLAVLVGAALTLRPDTSPAVGASPAAQAALSEKANLSLALILIMFAYGGWADMSFVAAEVREPGRNIFRALLLGTAAVAVIYLAVNLAFLAALGVLGLANSKAAAAEVLSLRFGSVGARAISLLVVVSCLGAINGMLLAGSRVFFALGRHHAIFGWLGEWNAQSGVPLRSLLLQTAITLALVAGFGLGPNGFSSLVVFTGPFYWGFIGLVGLALIVLRRRGASGTGFRVPLYPWSPLLFFLTSTAMAYASLRYIAEQAAESLAKRGTLDLGWQLGALWSAAVVIGGVVVAFLDRRTDERD